MLKDINPTGDSYPDFFAEYNGTLYFSARDGSNGYELWTTDGTAAGTQMFKDINPGSGAGFFIDPAFTEYNGKLYFIAEDGSNGDELWVTDGTAAGTEKIQPATTGAFLTIVYFYFKTIWLPIGLHFGNNYITIQSDLDEHWLYGNEGYLGRHTCNLIF